MVKRLGGAADRPEERLDDGPAGAGEVERRPGREEPPASGEDDRALARMIGWAVLVGLGLWAGLLAVLLF